MFFFSSVGNAGEWNEQGANKELTFTIASQRERERESGGGLKAVEISTKKRTESSPSLLFFPPESRAQNYHSLSLRCISHQSEFLFLPLSLSLCSLLLSIEFSLFISIDSFIYLCLCRPIVSISQFSKVGNNNETQMHRSRCMKRLCRLKLAGGAAQLRNMRLYFMSLSSFFTVCDVFGFCRHVFSTSLAVRATEEHHMSFFIFSSRGALAALLRLSGMSSLIPSLSVFNFPRLSFSPTYFLFFFFRFPSCLPTPLNPNNYCS